MPGQPPRFQYGENHHQEVGAQRDNGPHHQIERCVQRPSPRGDLRCFVHPWAESEHRSRRSGCCQKELGQDPAMPGKAPGRPQGQDHAGDEGQQRRRKNQPVREDLHRLDAGVDGGRRLGGAGIQRQSQQPQRDPQPGCGGADMDDKKCPPGWSLQWFHVKHRAEPAASAHLTAGVAAATRHGVRACLCRSTEGAAL